MIKALAVSALRSLSKNKGFTFLNISGLALGLATFFLIALYVYDELSFDRFHSDFKRIYRVNTDVKWNGATTSFAISASPLAGALENNFSEVEVAVRISPALNIRFRKGNEVIAEPNALYADPSIFKVFTLPLIAGNPVEALINPDAIVVSEASAKKYFNSTDVLGKILFGPGDSVGRMITGVMKDLPDQSHFKADFLISQTGLSKSKDLAFNSFNYNTYLLLKTGADYKKLESEFPAFLRKHLSSNMNMDDFEKGGNFIRINLTPLGEIHLQSNRQRELSGNSDIQYAYIFSAIAVFILILACVNFMNLSTARSAGKAKEAGIRKVLGSKRKYLVFQFLLESLVITCLAAMVAVTAVIVFLPLFNQLAAKNISWSLENLRWVIIFLFSIVIIVSLLAGSYPAFFLSSFRPLNVLKGKLSAGFQGASVRNIIVVFQFSISIFLIIGTLVINNQLAFIREKNLGYDREQVVVIKNASALENPKLLKEQVRQLAGVTNASLSGYLPTGGARGLNSISKGHDHGLLVEFWTVDEDYLPTMGIKLAAGRNFSTAHASDSLAIIVNEAAAKILGIASDPLNQEINTGAGKNAKAYKTIGVIKDFNFNSLHDNIEPLIMVIGDDWRSNLSVRSSSDHLSDLVSNIRKQWKSLAPDESL